jgi:hypothetical protein
MDCDVEVEVEVNPTIDLVGVTGKGSASKLVEGCRPTLSAIVYAEGVHATPDDESDFVVLMSANADIAQRMELLWGGLS